MDTSLPVARHERKNMCVDGIPGKPRPLKKSRVPRSAAPDFLSRRFDSRVFLRIHQSAYQCVKTVEKKEALFLDGIRRPCLSPIGSPLSFVERIQERYRAELYVMKALIVRSGALFALSPRMALRTSLVGAILFGAVSTAMAYRYLGERALAREETSLSATVALDSPAHPSPDASATSGPSGRANESDERFVNEVVGDFESIRKAEKKEALEGKIREMVAGYPIEDMVPFIMQKDTIVAAFLVGIAKKESAWGKRVPLMKSHDCFNYWGYRGKRRLMGTGGHTCFNSPKDAIDTVSRRLEKLVSAEKIDTPAEMMVAWKCGYDCSTHSKADTRKWVQDVDLYFHKLDEES